MTTKDAIELSKSWLGRLRIEVTSMPASSSTKDSYMFKAGSVYVGVVANREIDCLWLKAVVALSDDHNDRYHGTREDERTAFLRAMGQRLVAIDPTVEVQADLTRTPISLTLQRTLFDENLTRQAFMDAVVTLRACAGEAMTLVDVYFGGENGGLARP